MKYTHFQLCKDLANSKKTLFIETPLGSVWSGQARGKGRGTQIADVCHIRPSYADFNIDIYECKISRADFQSDIRSEKWKGYLPHCHRFYFAVPKGLIDKTEVPAGAGLIIRTEKGWHTAKVAPKRYPEIPQETLMAMIFYRNKADKNLRDRYYIEHGWMKRKTYLKRLGKKISEAIEYYQNKTGDYLGLIF